MKVKVQIVAVVDQDTSEDMKNQCDLKKVKAAVKEAAKRGEKSPIFREGLKIVFMSWQRIYLSYYANGVGPISKSDRDTGCHDWWSAWEPM